jgi:hypothetical protein
VSEPTQEGTVEWLEAEEVIGDALANIPITNIFTEAAPREIMRALETAGFIVLKRGIPIGPR